jgi:hypothetical protein
MTAAAYEKPKVVRGLISGALGYPSDEDALPNIATSPWTGRYGTFGNRPNPPTTPIGFKTFLSDLNLKIETY